MRCLCILAVSATISGCASLDYYAHLARGQFQLLSQREPIQRIEADPARDPVLRERLKNLEQARRYASATLGLPDNGSYTRYADLGRDYVVWNVFATPEFSLVPHESCFPIAGCVAYRGYFELKRATAEAARLRQLGLETHMGGVSAYSTLGWFDDPVLNTMMRWSDAELIGTVFHELAHQKLYVKNDTAFNESFASFVEQEGLRQYAAASGLALDNAQERQREHEFTQLVLRLRERLAALYAEPLPAEEMRAHKLAAFEDVRAEYRTVRDQQWGGDSRYDRWFAAPLNNARLLPFGLYDQWVPAFATLFHQSGDDWTAFYEAAATFKNMKPTARQERLQALATVPQAQH